MMSYHPIIGIIIFFITIIISFFLVKMYLENIKIKKKIKI